MPAVHCTATAPVLPGVCPVPVWLVCGLPEGLPEALDAGEPDGLASDAGWLHAASARTAVTDRALMLVRTRMRGEIMNAITTHSRQSLLQSTTFPGEWPIGAGL
ncbi:hypothetical protein GCM10009569_10510 [Arthrobacter russicus]